MKIFKSLSLVLMVLLTLTSCEETENSQVKISVEPGVPTVYNFPYSTGDDTVDPPWFGFQLRFENSSDKDVVIQTVEMSYRFDDQKEFSDPETIDSKSGSDDVFLYLRSGASGLEHDLIPVATFNRFLGALEKGDDPKFPNDFNYYIKLEAKGHFVEAGDRQQPVSEFNQVIYFRTRGVE